MITHPDRNTPVFRYPAPFDQFGASTRAYDVLRESTPVCRAVVPSGWLVWLVLKYVDIYEVLTSKKFSREEAVRVGAALVSPPGIELQHNVLQNADGATHEALRRVFFEHYRRDHVATWESVIRAETHRAIDRLRPRPHVPFDLRADVFEPATRRAAEILFGFPIDRDRRIIELFFDATLVHDLRVRLYRLVRGNDSSTDTSYLAFLRKACAKGLITEDDLVNNLLVFATATFEGVGGPFLGGVFALLRNRDQWELCLEDRSLVPNAVEEALRCYPNADGLFLRIVMDEVELRGVRIARGDAVLAPTSAANTDPEVFSPDPRRFDVCRPNSNKNLAFGAGTHYCMGALLSRVWMRTTLNVLLDRLPTLRLAMDPTAATYRTTELMNVLNALYVSC